MNLDFPDFEKFQETFIDSKKASWLDCKRALEFIAQHHQVTQNTHEKPRIIVMIDEILKAKQPENVLHSICSTMENAHYYATSLDVLSTTLDPAVIESEKTGSSRKVRILPLPALRKLELLFPPEKNRLLFDFATRCGGVRSNYYNCTATSKLIFAFYSTREL